MEKEEKRASSTKTAWMDEEVYASALTDFFHKKPIDYAKKMKTYNEDELF